MDDVLNEANQFDYFIGIIFSTVGVVMWGS